MCHFFWEKRIGSARETMAKMLFAQYKTPKIQGAARMLPPPHHDWEVLYSLPLPPLEKSWTTKTHLLSQVCMVSRNSSLANCFSNFCRASNSCKGNTARSLRPLDHLLVLRKFVTKTTLGSFGLGRSWNLTRENTVSLVEGSMQELTTMWTSWCLTADR